MGNLLINNSMAVGKYLVSPLVRRLEDGLFTASVSIRSGRGSASHDRVDRVQLSLTCIRMHARFD